MLNLRQINHRLFISGGWQDVKNDAIYLRQLGIDCVLDLQFLPDEREFNAQAQMVIADHLEHYQIEYVPIAMFDGANTDLPSIYEEGYHAIDVWLLEKPRRKILIKCSAGLSRSPSMLIYYLCRKQGLSYSQAFAIVDAVQTIYMASELKEHLKATFGAHELIQLENGQATCICGKGPNSVMTILRHIEKEIQNASHQ